MIEYATSRDKEDLIRIWKEVFGDEENYIEQFLNKIYKDENTLVWRVNGEIAAMLFMVPCAQKTENQLEPVMYLYALATIPAYRKKGIMSQLVEKANQIAKERNYINTFLIPASHKLSEYYQKLGYTVQFNSQKGLLGEKELEEILAKEETEIQMQSNQISENGDASYGAKLLLKVEDYKSMYQYYLKSDLCIPNSIVLSQKQGEFILQVMSEDGYEMASIWYKNCMVGYIIMKKQQEILQIYQCFIEKANMYDLLKLLQARYQFHTICLEQGPEYLSQLFHNNKQLYTMQRSLSYNNQENIANDSQFYGLILT